MMYFKIAIIIAISGLIANGLEELRSTYMLGKRLDSVKDPLWFTLDVHYQDATLVIILILILMGVYNIL